MEFLIGMQGIVEGGKIEGGPIICDVRDVAAAHILAAETPSASGRQARLHHRFLLLASNPGSGKATTEPFVAMKQPAYFCQ